MESETLELKALLEKLRAEDAGLRVFGSDSHRYRIGPALSEEETSAFEQAHGIRLPEDLRLYLNLVGNGSGREPRPHPSSAPWMVAGAGPGYGIYPLLEMVSGNATSRPFPFTEEVNHPTEWGDDDSAWDGDIPGALEISTSGCSGHTHLIVAGPARGTVWEGHDYAHFAPTHQSFTQWMRARAERSLRVLANEALVPKLAPGMTQEQVVAAVGGEWKERKNQHSEEYYFEAPEIPAQLTLSGAGGAVTAIRPWPFV